MKLTKSERIILMFLTKMDESISLLKINMMCFMLCKYDPKHRYFKFKKGKMGPEMIGLDKKIDKLVKMKLIEKKVTR